MRGRGVQGGGVRLPRQAGASSTICNISCDRVFQFRELYLENQPLRRELAAAAAVRPDRRVEQAAAGAAGDDRQGRRHAFERAAGRRDRHRQGTLRPGDPLSRAAAGREVPGRELRHAAGGPAGSRAVRHRREGGTAGPLRSRRRRDACISTRSRDLPLGTQTKLLRAIEYQESMPVTGARDLSRSSAGSSPRPTTT